MFVRGVRFMYMEAQSYLVTEFSTGSGPVFIVVLVGF